MVPLLILAAVAVVAYMVILTFGVVKKWFKSNEIQDKNHVSILFKQGYKDGKYKTVGGVLNRKTNTLATATAWESEKLDSTIGEMPRVSVIRDED